MNNYESADKKRGGGLNRGAWSRERASVSQVSTYFVQAILLIFLLVSLRAFATEAEKFERLQVGENIYQNVTVTTKAKDFVLIAHSSGITSIKVKDLPEDVRDKLGYARPSRPGRQAVELLIRSPAAKGAALMEGMKAKFLQVWNRIGLASMQVVKTYRGLILAAALLLMANVFSSYCGMLICQKVRKAPGILVWVPFFQPIPLLRAASMSTWWFVALFVPGLNVVVYVRWCIKIVEAREKTLPLAMMLIFPLTSWLAFLFLAFSADSHEEKEMVRMKTMALQTCLRASGSQRTELLQGEQRIVA